MRSISVTSQLKTSLRLPSLLVVCCLLLALLPVGLGFKYHEFCATPPIERKTSFPLYRMEVDSKVPGLPWAYRQNDTIKVSVKALYQQYKIRQLFLSVPSMTTATTEKPAKRIHQGKWAWDMKGGVVPLDCSSTTGSFGGGADAVRNLWWYPGGFFNVTAEWDPLNTIYNAYNIDMVMFEAYVSPDKPVETPPPGVYGPIPEQPRWIKLTSDQLINLDYVDLQRFITQNPHASWVLGGVGGGAFFS